MLDPLQLTGRTTSHVISPPENPGGIHPETAVAFASMREAAALAGFELTAVSGFRSFDRQKAIWNAKWRGQRQLYDRQGRPVDPGSLSDVELTHALLAWSAFPGASRHHWGTDLDVIDEAARPSGYRVQLLPDEFGPQGPFYALRQWMEANLDRFGFFFPYQHDRGGVAPEPWHISHAPLAEPALQALTPEILLDALQPGGVEGVEILRHLLPDLHRQYVTNISFPDPPPSTSISSRR